MPIVAVVNQKGGVGKTTVALGLAASASHRGLRVLVVDLDPQANATSGLGVWDAPTTVDAVLASDDPGSAARLAGTAAWPMDHGAAPGAVAPSVVASTPGLAAREPQLANDPIGAQDRLQIALEGHGYDLVVIDCPPSLGLLTLNGLVAARGVMIPLQCEYYALEGLADVLKTIELVRASANPDLQVDGIVLTMFSPNNLANQVAEEIRKTFKKQVFKTIIPRNVRLSEAPSHGKPILLYDVSSKGCQSYLSLAKEVAARMDGGAP